MKKLLAAILALLGATSAGAATVTHRVNTASTLDQSTYVSGTFTPAAGELVVAACFASDTTAAGAMTDSRGLGFTKIASATARGGLDTIYLFISNNFSAGAAMTVTCDVTPSVATGAIVEAWSVSGMQKAGAAASKQVASASNQAAGGTPAVTFAAAVLTGNPTLGVVGNATNPATLTPPTGWVESADVGYLTPTTGGEFVSRDSGFTGATITWGSTSASAFGALAVELDASAVSVPATTFIQSFSSGTNNINAGNAFKITFPDPIPAGNALVLCLAYPFLAGRTVTVTDNAGNAWPATPTLKRDDSSNIPRTAAIFVLPNTLANVQTVTVTFDASVLTFQATLEAFSGVATAAPLNGTTVSSPVADTLTAGSFTPGNNDAGGGNLLIHFSVNAGGNATTGITQGPLPWQLDEADIKEGFIVQHQIQTVSAAIAPTVTVNSTSGTWISIALALKISSGAGGDLAAGMHIRHVYRVNKDSANGTLQFPTTGNLFIAINIHQQLQNNLSAITDTKGNTWTKITTDTGVPQILHAVGAAPDTQLVLTITVELGAVMILYDISGAATAPFDLLSQCTGVNSTNATIVDACDITPTTAGGIVIGLMNIGAGPTGGAPGGVYDNTPFTGETDADLMNTGDGASHRNNVAAALQNIQWTPLTPTASLPTTWNASAAAYKAPAAPTGGSPKNLPMMGCCAAANAAGNLIVVGGGDANKEKIK